MTENDGTGFEEIVVRRAGDLGRTTDSQPPVCRGVGDYGWGTQLQGPAWQEIRERIDSDELEPKEHVATVHYDLDEWEYTIDYHVKVKY